MTPDTTLTAATAAAGAAVAGQIAWVLVPAGARDTLTVGCVVLFAAASLLHAWAVRGPAWAGGYAAITLTVGWTAEAIGVTTGWPFGDYAYASSLGPKLGPVPAVIPLAWLMMAYPVLLAARRTCATRLAQVLYAAALLTAWDLFLDPQMTGQGHWTWTAPTASIPGIPGIPVQNFVGWFAVGLLLFGLLVRLPDDPHDPDDRVPAALLLWVFASNVMANALFWDRPSVALVGGLAMGALLLPWLRRGIASRAFWTRP